jgi:hypothetical protein
LNLKLLEDVVCAMDMTTPNTPPIACTLAPGDYQARLAWIAELARDALLGFERHDLVLELRYALQAADRVREMVRKERECCGFLTFELEETPREIRLTIRAPEEARGALLLLFGQFLASARDPMEKAARTAAVVSAAGAVACGVCCVLPVALPAVALAGAGGILAWFAGAFAWVTAVAVAAVAGAWGWVWWQSARSRRRPAASTLYLMALATALLAVALLWPLIEPKLRMALQG